LYTPNTVTLDQAVVYLDRFPDTVQKDHFDWGLRMSAIYGENYRYTTSYGLASYQLLDHNKVNGYDFPMYWVEGFWPQVADGFLVRVGRFISSKSPLPTGSCSGSSIVPSNRIATFGKFSRSGTMSCGASPR